MTLAELGVTIAVLFALGLAARGLGLSAIPAYLAAGILLGPNEPDEIVVISPSEVTEFVAELGIVFLLFFLGLEFSLSRLRSTGRHAGLGGWRRRSDAAGRAVPERLRARRHRELDRRRRPEQLTHTDACSPLPSSS